MYKSLFTNTEQYSEDGCSFADEATEVLRPLLAKWASKGFTGHEMLVILLSVANLERSRLLVRRILERAPGEDKHLLDPTEKVLCPSCGLHRRPPEIPTTASSTETHTTKCVDENTIRLVCTRCTFILAFWDFKASAWRRA
jgi:hypothetical protein